MEVLVNDLGTASFAYIAPQNTVSLVYSVYDNTNDEYIQYEEVTAAPDTETLITVTVASPAVVTDLFNELSDGDAIRFSTTGDLPTGITAGTIYYVLNTDVPDKFNIYTTSPTNLVNTSGTQSGVHKVSAQG